jgi:hypothetical protein
MEHNQFVQQRIKTYKITLDAPPSFVCSICAVMLYPEEVKWMPFKSDYNYPIEHSYKIKLRRCPISNRVAYCKYHAKV